MMESYLNPVYIFAFSSCLVLYHSTKNYFLPELWFEGLHIILPHFQRDTPDQSKKKKKETLVQLVPVREFTFSFLQVIGRYFEKSLLLF
jgi:hypothetical protein